VDGPYAFRRRFFPESLAQEIGFFLREGSMEKLLVRLIKIIVGLILLLILIPGIYIAWGYYKIDSSFRAKEKQIVRPRADAGSLSEVGYVKKLQIVTCIKNRTKRVYWWVRIPATHKQYLCEWQYGFSGFKEADAVTLIHKIVWEDFRTGNTGYLIGQQRKTKDTPASIATLGVEDIKD
jgi:hypothetical protein